MEVVIIGIQFGTLFFLVFFKFSFARMSKVTDGQQDHGHGNYKKYPDKSDICEPAERTCKYGMASMIDLPIVINKHQRT